MIHVVVPSYNCGSYIGRCLDSIYNQDFDDFTVTVIDDASDVNNLNVTEQTCASFRFELLINPVNMGAGYNIYTAAHRYSGPDDVIVLVDGDDFLAHGAVLSRVNEIYLNSEVWLMWSQYEPFPYHTTVQEMPGGARLPVRVDPAETKYTQTQSADYSPEDWATPGFHRTGAAQYNHLITFRRFLFTESVEPDDLKLADGSWAKAGYDRMIMTPMLERAGERHTRFKEEVLYCYNSVNPNSDVSVRLPDAQEAHARVASITPKTPLSSERVAELRER